jgi:hypothetical protein
MPVPKLFYICVGEVTWGLPTQKEMKKYCPKKQRFRVGKCHIYPNSSSVDDNLLGFTEIRHTPAKRQKAKEGGKKGELSLHGFSKIE